MQGVCENASNAIEFKYLEIPKVLVFLSWLDDQRISSDLPLVRKCSNQSFVWFTIICVYYFGSDFVGSKVF